MYNVLCTMYYVLCTMYNILCTIYYVLCTKSVSAAMDRPGYQALRVDLVFMGTVGLLGYGAGLRM